MQRRESLLIHEVDLGLLFKQEVHGGGFAAFGGVEDRGAAVLRNGVHIRAGLDEVLDHLKVAAGGCLVQRRESVVRGHVRVSAERHEVLHHLGRPDTGGIVKRRGPGLRDLGLRRAGTDFQQVRDDGVLLLQHGAVEDRHAVLVLGIRIDLVLSGVVEVAQDGIVPVLNAVERRRTAVLVLRIDVGAFLDQLKRELPVLFLQVFEHLLVEGGDALRLFAGGGVLFILKTQFGDLRLAVLNGLLAHLETFLALLVVNALLVRVRGFLERDHGLEIGHFIFAAGFRTAFSVLA